MAKSIYDQHRASFPQVSAYVVMHGADRVATIAIKFPRDGAGRLYAYVHWVGEPMVRGSATGYGYDKVSAALASAARRLPETLPSGAYADGTPHYSAEQQALFCAFRAALWADDGLDWQRHLQNQGFAVWQAV